MRLRNATHDDLSQLLAVARSLDSVNLPANEVALSALLERSEQSFSGAQSDPAQRTYVFVLEADDGNLLGCSMAIARHGTVDEPHYFFQVEERWMRSASLDRDVSHRVLTLRSDTQGLTELGGLVVRPEARGFASPGKQLSLVRLLYVAMHRELFCDRLLAELMPPLSADGSSALWEALGSRLTGLSYREADQRSRGDKRFIAELFPTDTILASFLPLEAQQQIGRVGPATFAAQRMLENQGFRYAAAVDPFDGGPHFVASTDTVAVVRTTQKLIAAQAEPETLGEARFLIATERASEPRFMAMVASARIAHSTLHLSSHAWSTLGLIAGDHVHATPFDLRGQPPASN